MKLIQLILVFTIVSTFSFSQDREIKLAMGVSSGFSINIADVFYETEANLGINFHSLKNDMYLYLSYAYIQTRLYKGHFIGGAFHYHFLNPEKRFRPLLSISILSEIADNYKNRYLMGRNAEEACFGTRDFYSGQHPYSDHNSPYLNSSNIYHSTPFLANIAAGFSVRLINHMFLNFSIGYDMQIMKYKYLEWFDKDNYQDKLNNAPIRTKIISYVSAQLGLSYTIPFHKSKK